MKKGLKAYSHAENSGPQNFSISAIFNAVMPRCFYSASQSCKKGVSPRITTFRDDFMMKKVWNKGFTLIELLVVVLIIGILAAVALPQYRVAVAKSRIGSYMTVARSIGDAQEVYYMEHGEYTEDLHDLDINLANCVYVDIRNGREWNCGDSIQIDNSRESNYAVGNIILRYCPGHNTDYYDCANHRDMQLNFYLSHPHNEGKPLRVPNTILCETYTELGKKICKSMGGVLDNTVSY